MSLQTIINGTIYNSSDEGQFIQYFAQTLNTSLEEKGIALNDDRNFLFSEALELVVSGCERKRLTIDVNGIPFYAVLKIKHPTLGYVYIDKDGIASLTDLVSKLKQLHDIKGNITIRECLSSDAKELVDKSTHLHTAIMMFSKLMINNGVDELFNFNHTVAA